MKRKKNKKTQKTEEEEEELPKLRREGTKEGPKTRKGRRRIITDKGEDKAEEEEEE